MNAKFCKEQMENDGKSTINSLNLYFLSLTIQILDLSFKGVELIYSVSLPGHKRNLQLLMTAIYKTKSHITPNFMTEIFVKKNPPYHLRSKNLLQMPKARTVRFGIESISFLGCKLWHGISTNIKQSLNISVFKKRIKEWKGDKCNCRLCKTFLAQVGFLN